MTTKKITKFSNALPISHLILFSICTFGIYELIWFHKNWDEFKKHKNLNIKPGWRVVGLFVPIYNLILVYEQFKDVKNYAEKSGIKQLYSPGWILLGYIILTVLWKLPDPLWPLTFLSVLPLTVVQKTLNEYWRKEQNDLPENKKLTSGQIALIAIGGLLVALSILGIFIPE